MTPGAQLCIHEDPYNFSDITANEVCCSFFFMYVHIWGTNCDNQTRMGLCFTILLFVQSIPLQDHYRARTGFSLCRKFSQGKTCFHYREPLFSLQGPCIHYREFPVRITTQGNPCSHYREWVCSALIG